MAQRQGRVVAKAVPNAKSATLMPHVRKKVLPESVVYTDEFTAYDRLKKYGYRHSRVHYSAFTIPKRSTSRATFTRTQ
jgi:transposase